jgi:hypothetical protein
MAWMPERYVREWCGRLGPKVARIVFDVQSKPPGGQIECIASGRSDILRCDAILGQVAQVCRIELHRSNVMRAIGIAAPLAWLAGFFFGYSKHDVRWNVVFHGGRYRADYAFLHLGRDIQKRHDSVLSLCAQVLF